MNLTSEQSEVYKLDRRITASQPTRDSFRIICLVLPGPLAYSAGLRYPSFYSIRAIEPAEVSS